MIIPILTLFYMSIALNIVLAIKARSNWNNFIAYKNKNYSDGYNSALTGLEVDGVRIRKDKNGDRYIYVTEKIFKHWKDTK